MVFLLICLPLLSGWMVWCDRVVVCIGLPTIGWYGFYLELCNAWNLIFTFCIYLYGYDDIPIYIYPLRSAWVNWIPKHILFYDLLNMHLEYGSSGWPGIVWDVVLYPASRVRQTTQQFLGREFIQLLSVCSVRGNVKEW